MGLKTLAVHMTAKMATLVPMDTASGLAGIATSIESFLNSAAAYVYLVAAICIFCAGLALMVSNPQTRAQIKGTMIAIIVGALLCSAAIPIGTEICSMLSGGGM